MENILEVENLNKTYAESNFELKNITFSIPYGSIVGFIGENGAGKTSTMGAILGTLKVDNGSIKIFNQEIDYSNEKWKEEVGVVFDHMNFPSNLNIIQISNILSYIYQQWDTEKFFHYIEDFSLPKNDKVGNFSRGMSMKLSIAVALSHNTKLLMLDEATSGLDPKARNEILGVFLEFVKDKNRSILLSSHITSDIEKIADYLIFIKKGKIILQTSKKELLDNYAVIQCASTEVGQIDSRVIVSHRYKAGLLEMLVSDKNTIPATFKIEDNSLDEITLLLMEGDCYEGSHA
ncbi:ABC transporter ATP-binding protein [Ornithinibacillus massiliensis]|uniref:ABC transporter ATP-binding protein n=1 Tax=Ornithinibacillus massiliensis TaxID=1944633 RepID=A0ABS5M8X5_9BACI|nr:ABC transporter ATP-binding protein [Ornithinibacillus massiliensis]MBS3678760.1 ABC transporter ATP-binding protein [Ornithinibacillus massiliensis]